MRLTLRAPWWRPLVVVGLVAFALAGCGGDDDVPRSDRPAGAAGLRAALQETLGKGEQDATLVVRRGTGADEEASVEALRMTGRFDPRGQTGTMTLTVAAPAGTDLELPKLELEWDTEQISVNGGPPVARVKARAGSGGQVAAAADQIQGLVDVVGAASGVGQAEPGVWTFEVPADAGDPTAPGGGRPGRGEARAGDGKGLEQISLQVPTGSGQGDFNLLLLTLG